MKKAAILCSILLVLLIAGYMLIKNYVLQAKNFKPDERKRTSAVDLRPDIIARLQQIVKDGSDGLYLLSIEQIEPDIIASKLDATGVSIRVDSQGFKALQQSHKLPDDIFNLRFGALHIDGIGINDLLHKNQIAIGGISFKDPAIEAWHKKQPYNQQQRINDQRLSLYQRLTKQLDRIQIGKLRIERGLFTDHDVDNSKVNVFRDISIVMDEILVDSTTQFARNRFLFAKHAAFTTKDYRVRTGDSLYEFRVGDLAVLGEQHQIVATGFRFKPIGTRRQFERTARTRQEMFTLSLPKVVFTEVSWWAMLHRESLIAATGEIDNADIDIYLNRALPSSGHMTRDNFPQQLLLALDIPVSFRTFSLNNARLSYEEYSPDTRREGKVIFEKLNGKATNVTNIPTEIRANPTATLTVSTLFMGVSPMQGHFTFLLNKSSIGSFAADLSEGAMNYDAVDGFAEPLGQVSITSGHLTKAVTHLSGNQNKISGTLEAEYHDLHVAPLKAREDRSGKLKKKRIIGPLTNILVRNNNPGINGGLRQSRFSLDRADHGNFFNFLWSAIKMGLLKLIGIPASLGM